MKRKYDELSMISIIILYKKKYDELVTKVNAFDSLIVVHLLNKTSCNKQRLKKLKKH